jgi:hypothetical protein
MSRGTRSKLSHGGKPASVLWVPVEGVIYVPIGWDSVARHVGRDARHWTWETSLMSSANTSTKPDLGAKSATKVSSGRLQISPRFAQLHPRFAISLPTPSLSTTISVDDQSKLGFSFFIWIGSRIVSPRCSLSLHLTKLKRNPLVQSFTPSDIAPVAIQTQAAVTSIAMIAHAPIATKLPYLPSTEAK